MNTTIAIIDYGLGNPLSIKNMLKKVGAGQVVISNDIEVLQSAKCLILPGVGHFTQGMQNLQNQGLIEVLNELVLIQKKPILGICLGMQLMTSYSEEGNCSGLGWIEANTKKFVFANKDIKVPHMAWSDTHFIKKPFSDCVFEEEIPRFYHVHSYFVNCKEQEDVLSTAEYGEQVFHNGFIKDNIIGVQFHPEKSHVFGQAFFKTFLDYIG
jgi:glutamine amidotransferase